MKPQTSIFWWTEKQKFQEKQIFFHILAIIRKWIFMLFSWSRSHIPLLNLNVCCLLNAELVLRILVEFPLASIHHSKSRVYLVFCHLDYRLGYKLHKLQAGFIGSCVDCRKQSQLASSPGPSQLFNVTCWKTGGTGHQNHMTFMHTYQPIMHTERQM